MTDPSPDTPATEAAPSQRRPLRRMAVAAAGLLVGGLLVLVTPSSWLFVQTAGGPHAEHATAAADDASKYACPMFCVVMDHMPEDGRCPVCGMEMTVVTNRSALDRAEQHMVGLQAGRAVRLPLVRTIRTVGEVDYDETRLSRITTRVAGWLEEVTAETTWQRVEEGQPLASIYSPELYAAEREYLVELRAAEDGRQDALPAAARRRLGLLGVDDRDIAELEQRGEPRDRVLLRAPHGGVLVERRAVEGANVARGALLYTVADLSKVWVQARVFETDLAMVRVGQTVRLEVGGSSEPSAGGGPRTGRVAFVDPVLDRASRTGRVRIQVDNPAGPDGTRPLRVGQRVDAWIEASVDATGGVTQDEEPAPAPLAVPRTAVLHTGERSIVYVLFAERQGAEGMERDYHLDPDRLPDDVYYELLQVRVGALSRRRGGAAAEDEYYPVLGVVPPPPQIDPATGQEQQVMSLRRLTPGVTVVTHGNLLLDSQAQLAGRPSLLFPKGNRGGSSDPHAGH